MLTIVILGPSDAFGWLGQKISAVNTVLESDPFEECSYIELVDQKHSLDRFAAPETVGGTGLMYPMACGYQKFYSVADDEPIPSKWVLMAGGKCLLPWELTLAVSESSFFWFDLEMDSAHEASIVDWE